MGDFRPQALANCGQSKELWGANQPSDKKLSQSSMTLRARIAPILFMIIASRIAAEPTTEPPFPERVSAFLASAWTELSITTALFTDTSQAYATSICLKRDTPKSSVHFSLPFDPEKPSNDTVSESDMQTLFASTISAAEVTFAHKYPLEIYHSLPREEADEMVKSGKLKIGPNDVEMLIIRGKTTTKEVALIESGPFAPLDTTIQRLFNTKQVEIPESKISSLKR